MQNLQVPLALDHAQDLARDVERAVLVEMYAVRLADQQPASVPVNVVDILAMVGDREEFLAGGCTDYISKPFKLKDLLAMIQKYLPDNKKN